MTRSIFAAAHFNDEAAAYAFIEATDLGQRATLPSLWRC